jgi:gliding motility-associated-like protein
MSLSSIQSYHWKCFLWIGACLSWNSLPGQNLVPNPSFETFTACPVSLNFGSPLECIPWISPNNTSDYFNGCADPVAGISVPYNFQGYQYAHTGFAYTGMYYYIEQQNYREFVQVQLLQPLQKDSCYLVGFWMNLANEGCGVNHTGALLSVGQPSWPYSNPTLDWGGELFIDTLEWVYVFDYIIANGGENYITIGNFYNNTQTTIDPNCPWQFEFAYYYVDDVVVQKKPPEDIVLDLGGPETACDSFVIDPGLPGVSLFWSTGSHGASLTVYTSGTYSVTASYACQTYEASIEVTILGNASVDVGADVNLCAGETVTISLDENAGDYEWNDGSSDPEYSISTAGVYSVTLDDGCDQTSDTLEVSVTDPPAPFDLGVDTFFCESDVIQYQFDPSLGDFEWQDHANASTYVIDEAGTYALTISNDCGEESDEIEIEEIIPPDFTLGPDSIILCDLDVLEFDFDPSLGDFIWQDGSTSPFYTIMSSGLYSLTVSNECGILSSNIYATAENFPQINLGPDAHLCPGDTLILNGGSNSGLYTWQDGSHASQYVVTTSGTYALTVSNNCGFETGDIIVDYLAPISPPDLGPDFTLCPGEQAVLHLGNINATHIWNNNSTADSLLVTAGGTYSVHVFNSCQSFRDTVVVTINNNPPMVNLLADFALCEGQSDTLDAGVNNVSYQWNDGSQLSQLTVSGPGWYALTVSNSCGADHDSVFIADAGTIPFVALGPDTSMCAGNTFTINPASSGVNTWTWQDGSTNPQFTVSTPGLVFVNVTNACGIASDSMMIDLLPAIPALSIGPDTVICPGEAVTLSINIPGVDILWSDGSMNPNLTISDSALVYASISTVCGVSTDSMMVSLLPGVPALDLGPDQTICPGETFTLTPNIPGVTYLWQNGSTNSSYQVTQQETISLIISNACGIAFDTLQILESTDGPQVDLGPDLQACAGESVQIEANISGVNYLWQDGSTANEFVTDTSGTYILMVSNLCGTDSDTIDVDISGVPPLPDLGPDTMLCEGNTVLLTSNANPGDTLTWQDGSTGLTYLVSTAGTYSLRAANRCGDGRDSVVVSFMKGPDPFDLGLDTVLCPGQSFVLSAPVTPFEIEWQDGTSQPSIIASDDIVYKLTIRNSCGEEKDSLKVSFDQNIPLVNLGAPIPWCPEDIIPLDATQPFMATYLWSTGETTPTIVVTTPGIYSVEVGATCASTDGIVEVVPIEDCGPDDDLYIPNVFSPNDDNVNDVLTLFTGADVKLLAIQGTIFDRWGNMIFHSTLIPFVWDGRFHEDKMMPGVYVYVVEVKFKVGEMEFERVLSGDVTLIR